ncbi:MAG TPA: hypothetical protein VIN73_12415 [Vicingaceae bacterium]
MKNLILTTILLTMQLASFAHQDTPIKLTKEGKLIGLPENILTQNLTVQLSF